MRRAKAREDEERIRDRFSSTLAICASIIAAVRQARDERIAVESPRVLSVVADSDGAGEGDIEEGVERIRRCEFSTANCPKPELFRYFSLVKYKM